jgi:hypothetical protein
MGGGLLSYSHWLCIVDVDAEPVLADLEREHWLLIEIKESY